MKRIVIALALVMGMVSLAGVVGCGSSSSKAPASGDTKAKS
ncbi:MAG TPA: hypothetical protein VKE74_36215 [Gemmataceae bacterium]|nr:hypothetical protein [Gemmataceae bacterium]